ncbi:UDP-N-acetylmuramoyl-L-alanyl-D-glutamate--2,6-diaminopimelate ligase [Clostridium thermarum]|uniref:UDP-N-acetylmuramoyl-L-alanyl-D-glutamate--2, 6-diaminopimelate ligase n=1 Tax=Clostridium thermarum TaxID=1716543 RepID=UPI0013D3FF77|nr:UDP-N-acetylmuramoyl-L-alanyl-D-glutamate--2,6-diaminopimelate ligase [Clostridium thermarum]
MRICDLLQKVKYEVLQGNAETEVSGICWDSRRIKPGSVFICVKGRNVDRHIFAKQVVEDGASTLVVDHKLFKIPKEITVIKVADTRIALSEAAAVFYGAPFKKLKSIGVTGTNGKTSVTWFIEKILQSAGKTPGVIGTIENRIGGHILETVKVNPTTPDPLELHASFAEMAEKGASHVVMEVTSSALAQNRVHGCDFDIGIFTNLTQDHLEEHGTMENYKQEKLKLFKMCKLGVVNVDDPASEDFIREAKCPVITYGIKREADFMAEDIKCSMKGSEFILKHHDQRHSIYFKLPGKFNVYNLLAAISACYQCGLTIEEILRGINSIEAVKGRFQFVPNTGNFSVIVDYAHSPDGLENILNTVRELTSRRVILVFGCGGNRDKGKRPIMGKIGGSLSEYCIITSDNPRKEEPMAIIEDIEKGMIDTGCKYEKIVDRRKAIIRALSIAEAGDTVLLAGKGHEDYQIIGDMYMDFDDAEVVKEFFEENIDN